MWHRLAWDRGRAVALGAALASLGFGCVAEQRSEPWSSSGSAGSPSSGGAAAPPPAGTAQPMLVDVDPDRTMTAVPGQGVGVFTEYATGGHWHVWWICDTSATLQPCQFDVSVSVTGGAIAGVAAEAFASSDHVTQSNPRQVEAVTTTTLGASGLRFDTDPAAAITLDARLNGVEDGKFLFFVQGAVVNGSYAGTLTDPLMLEPGPATR